MTNEFVGEPFLTEYDAEAVQAVVVTAALNGSSDYLERLTALQSALDEPYRSVAGEILRRRSGGGFVDRNVLGGAFTGRRLSRIDQNGHTQPITAAQALNLVLQTEVLPGQAETYLEILKEKLERQRRVEFMGRVAEGVESYYGQPEALQHHLGRIITESKAATRSCADQYPPELLEIVPFAQRLEQRQCGRRFAGLDSGFEHLNYLCNGLGPELILFAAPPSQGKTTLVWQICCQVAERYSVPVIAVSLEQSKEELRVKALARYAMLNSRHILRGRLRSDDAEDQGKLVGALARYAGHSRNLTVVEGDAGTTVDVIRALVAEKKARAQADCALVMIDYLQCLPLSKEDAKRVTSTKDKVDLHVSALRRLARDLNTCVLCISSENRASYGSTKMDVFKESGGIEYSADIAAVLTRGEDGAAPGAGDYRLEDLNIIKNRNGECGVVKFKFYASRAEFKEIGREELRTDEEDRPAAHAAPMAAKTPPALPKGKRGVAQRTVKKET